MKGPASGLGRRRAVWVIVSLAALAAGAALSVVVRRAENPRTRRIAVEPVESYRIELGAKTEQERRGSEGPADELSATPVIEFPVRVVDGETAFPIPGATVSVIPIRRTEERADVGLPSATSRQVLTNDDGVCVVATAQDADAVALRAKASKYAPSELRVSGPKGKTPIEIRLGRGGTIAGVVVDRAGRPLEGIQVHASLRSPPAGSVLGHKGTFYVSDALSDAQGRYSLRHLCDGEYSLKIRADGWILARTSAHVACPGDEDVRLEAEAVRAFRLRVVHGKEKIPISPNFVRYHVVGDSLLEPGGASPSDDSRVLFEQGSNRVVWTGWVESEPGLFVGCVVLRSPQADPDKATVILQASNYNLASTTVTLMLPSELLSRDLSDEVPLTPGRAIGVGTVDVACRGTSIPPWAWIAPKAVLTVKHDEGGGVYRGQQLEEGVWRFVGVPAGRSEIMLSEGYLDSSWATVDVSPGDIARATVRWSRLTGIAFVLRRPDDHLVFDASIAVTFLDHEGVGKLVIDASRASRVRYDDGVLRHGFIGLNPGHYAWTLTKAGYRDARGEFHLAPEECKRIAVRLCPKP